MEENNKGRVCVTGGTGFVASWLIIRLLQHGYSVNTTVRSFPDTNRDVSFLTTLPGASERLRIFNADLDKPDSFHTAIEGCIGVFHVAHPMDFEDKEAEETKTNRAIKGTLGILQACLNSKTLKKIVYTSSKATVENTKDTGVLDENSWSDLDYIRTRNLFGASYCISKTLTERAALEFAETHSLDLVTVIPSWINGPFICSQCPGSVSASLALLTGDKRFMFWQSNSLVHTDDVANAHIFLFEHPNARGRYICSAVEIASDGLLEFLSTRYPEYKIRRITTDPSNKKAVKIKFGSLSSKKLLDTGFRYKYGLEEMFDDAIECCKQKGFL